MKKLLILILLICFYVKVNATNYYIASSGSDANNGTSTSTPWQTISKLNSFFTSLLPGDNVYFNRGDVFFGTITVGVSGASGSPITIGAYGTGAKPVITGFSSVTAWTNLGGNIWESTSAVSTLSYLNMVVINGVNTAMGRTPNAGTDYTFQSHTTTTITSSDLTGTPNWTGAELAMFNTTYTVARNPITAQSGGTLTYTPDARDITTQTDGLKFIIQNDPRTLDVQNEWYYNPSTKKLQIYSASSPIGVQVNSIASIVTITSKNYITFDNVKFTGSNTSSVELLSSTFISFTNCDFDFEGQYAIHGDWGAPANNLTVTNCTFNHSNTSFIDLVQDYKYANISNNNIISAGVLPYMMRNGGSSAQGIGAGGSHSTIAYNTIDSIGYNGIRWWGSYTNVNNNFIKNFCLNLLDGGGIYTYNAYPDSTNTGSKIFNNIIINNGVDQGIYLDDHSNGVEVYNNSISTVSSGIYLHNNYNISVHDNTVYDGSSAALLIDNYDAAVTLANVDIRRNIFFEKNIANPNFTAKFYLINGTIPATFTLDSNYYARPLDDNITIEEHFGGYNDTTLAHWQAYSNRDLNSNKSPKSITDVNDLYFTYNVSNGAIIVSLPYNYMDVKGTTYNGSITLQPYTSAVLIKNGAITGGGATNVIPYKGILKLVN